MTEAIDDGVVHTGGIYDPANFNESEKRRFGWDDRDVLIISARFEQKDGDNGSYASFQVTGIPDGEDQEFTKFYSAGNNTVAPDGKRLMPDASGKINITPKSEFGRFMAGLAASGLTADGFKAVETDIAALNGKRFHFVELELYDAKGQVRTEVSKKDGKTYAKRKPFPAKGGYKATAGGKANGHDDTVVQKAIETAIKAINHHGGTAKFNEVSKFALDDLASDPDRMKVAGLLADRKFFKVEGRPWNYDGTAISNA